MTPAAIGFSGELTRIDAPWSPQVVAVRSGELHIGFRHRAASLRAGEMLVVPGGVGHRPPAQAGCHVLPIEPRGTVNTGKTGGAMTPANDAWI